MCLREGVVVKTCHAVHRIVAPGWAVRLTKWCSSIPANHFPDLEGELRCVENLRSSTIADRQDPESRSFRPLSHHPPTPQVAPWLCLTQADRCVCGPEFLSGSKFVCPLCHRSLVVRVVCAELVPSFKQLGFPASRQAEGTEKMMFASVQYFPRIVSMDW